MDQIIVTRRNGTTLKLNSKENISSITKAVQNVELLGAETVNISVISGKKLIFYLGDKIVVIGRDYTLNTPPRERKVSEKEFQYELQFEGVQYDLLRASFNVNINTTNNTIQDISGDSITGNIKTFLDVLVSNSNRVFGSGKWIVGSYPLGSKTISLSFSDSDNCLSVLQNLCSEGNFNTEFKISVDANGVRTINIGASGSIFARTFEYGKGKGIYELTREKLSSSNIITRLNCFGSSRNIITPKYRSSKLCLPLKTKSQSFLENTAAISSYGIWESSKDFEDIYPKRLGVISGLGATVFEFIDSSMNFDLNEKNADNTTKYLIAGVSAKVSFNTGNLAGYEFEISAYVTGTKKFTIISQTDQNGYIFPSKTISSFKLAIGDEYVITNITMPQSYIDTAEAELAVRGAEYLANNSQPLVQYTLSIDSFFLKNQVGSNSESNIIWVGDYIPIKDIDLEVDKSIRVKGFTRDLMLDYSYQITIADLTTSTSVITRVIAGINTVNTVIKINNLTDPARARRNWKDSQEVLNMVFDAEGDFYTNRIKPLSIETSMLSVGSKSMQFGLEGTFFQPNFLGNKNRVFYNGGGLSHYSILSETGQPKYWTISDGDIIMNSDLSRYVYARCSRTTASATILFSTDKITVESDGANYHFLIGILNTVDANNTRALALMYGFTTVNGRFIKTGRIQSADGNTYFDLDAGEFKGNFKFSSGASVETSIATAQTAANNAQNSANNAQTTASNIQVGGRNLLVGASNGIGWSGSFLGSNSFSFTAASTGETGFIYSNYFSLNGGQEYTLSFDSKEDSIISSRDLFILPNDYISFGLLNFGFYKSVNYTRTVIVFTTPTTWNSTINVRLRIDHNGSTNGASATIFARNIKLEIGNKSTDYSVPQEDIDANISAAQTAAQAYALAKDNLLVIGGRNLFLSSRRTFYTTSGAIVLMELLSIPLVVGESYILSCKKVITGSPWITWSVLDNDWGRRQFIQPNEAFIAAYNNIRLTIYHEGNGGSVSLSELKLEKGTKATDWSLAPEDVTQESQDKANAAQTAAQNYSVAQINALVLGGRNILKRSGVAVSNANYMLCQYQFGDIIPKENEVFTITIKCTIGSDRQYLALYTSEGYANPVNIYRSDLNSDGIARKTFTNYYAAGRTPAEGFLNYQFYQIAGNNTSSGFIYWVKVERGTKGTDWSPAPEDVAEDIAIAKAKADSADYLRSAITANTTIEGGLVGTTLLQVKDLTGKVTGGLSGLANDNVVLFGGGTYSEALQSQNIPSAIAVIDRKDGSGHRAKGSLLWDRFGNLTVGLFKIVAGAFIGYEGLNERLRISTAAITTLSTLINGGWIREVQDYKFTNLFAGNMNANRFEMDYEQFLLTKTSSTSISIPSATSIRLTSGGALSYVLSNPNNINFVSIKEYFTISGMGTFVMTAGQVRTMTIPAGSYTLTYGIEVIFDVFYNSSSNVNVSNTTAAFVEIQAIAPSRTEVGIDGIFSFWSALQYFYYDKINGLQIKGSTDIPGILATGTIASAGGHSNRWGAKSNTANATYTATGIYDVIHSVGSLSYTVMLTPIGDGNRAFLISRSATSFRVIMRNSSNTAVAAGFDYSIFGNN